ncbi:unnamed protein product [Fusarium graminearum]|uniref:Chromosome 3, complete genome n=1 Tax=Gibberella zeae (strain ATCC MYA-4620 / CBS 123657 / FGSC 9075 / NRRL 31084 / PH-1) TaxID=229533 RepID=A0A0E0SMB1_GIBZE|nr:hypothetical protein FG05_35221 [Fusarium graminearum]CEF87574.1 unnamed protein product [Fusarium graminearum]CZS85695.1 unnamed protein product [Fusarium graminearum]
MQHFSPYHDGDVRQPNWPILKSYLENDSQTWVTLIHEGSSKDW